MITNYAKTTLRGMRRHWVYSAINVMGLAVGFLAGFFILLWVGDEMSFNSDYQDADQVYRVMRTYGDDQNFTVSSLTTKLDGVLDEDYPEIEYAALMSRLGDMALRHDEMVFRENGMYGGKDLFRILQYDFLAGEPTTALDIPESIVLSESLARKYFPAEFDGKEAEVGAASVLGQVLNLENRLDISVAGVYRDVVAQASWRPDFVLPVEEFQRRNDWLDDWDNNGLGMLVKLEEGADADAVSAKIRTLIQDHTDGKPAAIFLQSLSDVHLRSKYERGVAVGGRIDNLRIFSLVGIFILLIAAINFTNLSTARASQRTLEVGVRKTFGSGRGLLASQFLAESVFTALVAFAIAGLAVALLLPAFNTLTGKSISFSLSDVSIWWQFGTIAVLTGLAAGWYPAAYLSAFSVMGVLRRNDHGVGGGGNLRRGLVVFQFVLSVVLIIGAGTVSNQLDYIRGKNLGLDRNDLFSSALDGDLSAQYESYRSRMMESPAIESVTAGSNSPLAVGSSTARGVQWSGRPDDDNTEYNILQVDLGFLETMRINLSAGRDFSRERVSDSLNILVNQTAVRTMGLENPVGEAVTVWGRSGQIVGVVEDFHFASLYSSIDPLVIRLAPEAARFTFVRPAPGQTAAALAHFASVFREFNPQAPLKTSFLDSQFEATYRSEVVLQKLTGLFTLLAILVACLGLFGLASYTAARRTKEIGVRKVLGASVPRIIGLLSKEFVLLVFLAFVIAMPVSWLVMQRWLSQFQFHTELGWGLYLAAASGVLVITYATVGYQAIRAAIANPVEALRAE